MLGHQFALGREHQEPAGICLFDQQMALGQVGEQPFGLGPDVIGFELGLERAVGALS